MQHLELIVAALVAGAREKRGPDWCRKWGIGFARRRLGIQPRNVVGMTPDGESAELTKASDSLRRVCRDCRRCRLADE